MQAFAVQALAHDIPKEHKEQEMAIGKMVLALTALVLITAGAAQVEAQHTIRRSAQPAGYQSARVAASPGGCSSCGSHGRVVQSGVHNGRGTCDSCCSPCVNLCLPNPCVVIDKVGTALGGLRELFCNRCCYDNCGGSRCTHGCSDYGGTLRGEMPYLDHPHMSPPQPSTTPQTPTPAAAPQGGSSASRVYRPAPDSAHAAAEAVRQQRYHRAGKVRQVQRLAPLR